ncbi:hypothetical protein RGF97_15880 [Streptomyces roseicoloratus]|uniref:Uncharacterized protein n=1 Tax=Streptomyces roseicoloratus TaxID=2508722 RepID=A0ABY9RV36_9ACTN|nr:hypothetical protein [Streptomyces roseicoloratus]WMX46030.1 hypothetical protein RGF97_15880 [Streptomyces roseicoloratus]
MVGENAITWAPCMETTEPSFSFFGGSMPMPMERAPAWMTEKSPVRPVKLGSPAAGSHLPSSAAVSRSGSVVTKTTWSLSWSAWGSCLRAMAMLLIVSGQTSGQCV